MSDWMAYGSTVAAHPNEKFGNGNIKGVIGPEGANNAQKATSMIPTVLFGIPGAPFAAVIMALFMYLGFELGTPDLAHDDHFFDSLTFGFMWATVLVGVFCLLFTRYISVLSPCALQILFSDFVHIHYLGMCSIYRWVGRLFYSCSVQCSGHTV